MTEINVAMQKVIDELMEVNGLLETSLANATDEIERLQAIVAEQAECIKWFEQGNKRAIYQNNGE